MKVNNPAFNTKAVLLSNERANISELMRKLVIKVTLLYKWKNKTFSNRTLRKNEIKQQVSLTLYKKKTGLHHTVLFNKTSTQLRYLFLKYSCSTVVV